MNNYKVFGKVVNDYSKLPFMLLEKTTYSYIFVTSLNFMKTTYVNKKGIKLKPGFLELFHD